MDNQLEEKLKKTQLAFDSIARGRQLWKKKNWYYHQKIIETYRFLVPEGYRVLEIGSGDGNLLAALKPRRGLGVDASPNFIEMARAKHPGIEFIHGFAETVSLDEKFDYVILSDLVGYLDDVQLVFENLRRFCEPSTRILINYYNYLWEPLLTFGSQMGLRMAQKTQNCLSASDIENLLRISSYDVIKKTRRLIFPVYIPFISDLVNKLFSNLPFFRKLCLLDFVVARPIPETPEVNRSVSVVVACRNEKGNIEELVRRTPLFPHGMEMVFVDGRSNDGTREELDRVRALHPEKNIRVFDQLDSVGKGNAVRIGFEKCQEDILIILDADISVAPEDTLKFYNLLLQRKGELVSGTRMVYPMEKQAMRFLNILGNKFFSLAFTFLLEQTIKDTLCGTKALFRKDYEKIAKNRAYFGDFDPFGDFDLLFGAAKLNLKIVEVPVRYYERRYGTTKIHRFRHGTLLLGMCLIAMRRLKFV